MERECIQPANVRACEHQQLQRRVKNGYSLRDRHPSDEIVCCHAPIQLPCAHKLRLDMLQSDPSATSPAVS